jgi:hypothetical protein
VLVVYFAKITEVLLCCLASAWDLSANNRNRRLYRELKALCAGVGSLFQNEEVMLQKCKILM